MTKLFKELRENFGLFATGVAIAATSGDGKTNAITINSLSSVSLDPQLLLFCIENDSHNFDAFINNDSFSISLLTNEQIEISKFFAKSREQGGDVSSYFNQDENSNFLTIKDCLGYFECQKHKVVDAGDHHIVIGKITNFAKVNSDKKPLLYFKGEYLALGRS